MNKSAILAASALMIVASSCAMETLDSYDKAIRYLNASGDQDIARQLNTEYRNGAPEKAFYISNTGVGWAWDYPTLAAAKQDAKKECDAISDAGDVCVPFMINDNYVLQN